MEKKSTIYLAYLLRIWRSAPDGAWRASLEDPQSGERIGFSDLGAVFQFLTLKTEEDAVAAGQASRRNDNAEMRSDW